MREVFVCGRCCSDKPCLPVGRLLVIFGTAVYTAGLFLNRVVVAQFIAYSIWSDKLVCYFVSVHKVVRSRKFVNRELT